MDGMEKFTDGPEGNGDRPDADFQGLHATSNGDVRDLDAGTGLSAFERGIVDESIRERELTEARSDLGRYAASHPGALSEGKDGDHVAAIIDATDRLRGDRLIDAEEREAVQDAIEKGIALS